MGIPPRSSKLGISLGLGFPYTSRTWRNLQIIFGGHLLCMNIPPRRGYYTYSLRLGGTIPPPPKPLIFGNK
jgi:hypothetical protein